MRRAANLAFPAGSRPRQARYRTEIVHALPEWRMLGFDDPGAPTTAGGASGLVDTATGQPVTLSLNGSGVVEGRNSDGDLVFTVSVDASTGEVTLDQIRAVVHADTNDHDDATGLTGTNLISLTATATDGDGDTDAETIDLSDNLSFRDDGPDVTLTGNTEPSLEVDETDLATDATASFAGAFSTDFGEDGDGGVVYTLTTAGGASGLVDTATGQPVTLSLNGTVVEGRNTDGDHGLDHPVAQLHEVLHKGLLGAGEFVGESRELRVGLQVRIVLRDGEEAGEGGRDLV